MKIENPADLITKFDWTGAFITASLCFGCWLAANEVSEILLEFIGAVFFGLEPKHLAVTLAKLAMMIGLLFPYFKLCRFVGHRVRIWRFYRAVQRFSTQIPPEATDVQKQHHSNAVDACIELYNFLRSHPPK